MTQESEESNKPKGKGTYGSQVGRPSKKQNNEYMGGGMTDEYFGGGMVVNDARNRNVNTMGDGYAPKPSPKPMMPSQPPNQTENYDLYDQWVDKYNEDIQLGKDGGKVEKYKAGGKVNEMPAHLKEELDSLKQKHIGGAYGDDLLKNASKDLKKYLYNYFKIVQKLEVYKEF